jgi:hypothetical protein
MITLPANFIDNLISTMGGTISDVLPIFLFVAGIFLASWIIGNIAWGMIENKQDYFNNDKK